MYSYQGQNYTSLDEVPSDILTAFIQQNVLTETIAIQQNKILFWEEHYMRLMASMRILRMEIPLTFTMEHLAEKIQDITRHNVDNDFSGKVHLNVAKMAQPTFEQPIPKTAYSITVNPLEAPVFLYQKAPGDALGTHYLAQTPPFHSIRADCSESADPLRYLEAPHLTDKRRATAQRTVMRWGKLRQPRGRGNPKTAAIFMP